MVFAEETVLETVLVVAPLVIGVRIRNIGTCLADLLERLVHNIDFVLGLTMVLRVRSPEEEELALSSSRSRMRRSRARSFAFLNLRWIIVAACVSLLKSYSISSSRAEIPIRGSWP